MFVDLLIKSSYLHLSTLYFPVSVYYFLLSCLGSIRRVALTFEPLVHHTIAAFHLHKDCLHLLITIERRMLFSVAHYSQATGSDTLIRRLKFTSHRENRFYRPFAFGRREFRLGSTFVM